ncbi:unnamed protein product, partial [marine sediment metagenome]
HFSLASRGFQQAWKFYQAFSQGREIHEILASPVGYQPVIPT